MTARSHSASGLAPASRLVGSEPLRWHALAAASAACAAVVANVLLSPSRLWSPWLALALAAGLAAHGWLVLARALRPLGEAAPDADPLAGPAAAPNPEPAPRVDPGPPIFPDEPAAARPRRWVPPPPDGPAPVPRVAAFGEARIRPLPAPRFADVEPGAVRSAPSWPSWQPSVHPARINVAADDGWPAPGAFPSDAPGEPESAAAGW